MKFHLIAAAMLGLTIYLVYLLIYGFQAEMAEATPKIRKESVKALQEDKKIHEDVKISSYINRNIIPKEPPPKEQRAAVSPSIRTDEPSFQVQEEPVTRYTPDGKDYWCRSVPVLVETNPVKCKYPDSCYGCDGPIIRPEVESATPLCANGSMSQLFHVECCPEFSRGVIECPSSDACFHADNPPQDFCSCNGRPDCKLVQIGSKIECVCVQN